MADNNNISNINNTRPNGANSVNNAPQGANLGGRPIPRPNNMPARQPNGIAPRPISTQPGVAPRPMGTQPGVAPRPISTQPGVAPRPMGTQPGVAPRPVGMRPNTGMPGRPNNMQSRPLNAQTRPMNMPPRQHNLPRPQNPNTANINRAPSTARFERGSRTLSHVNGGSTGAKLYRINRSNEDDLIRRKVGGVILDTELIQDANKQKLADTKSKQKTAIIVVLSMLLALSIVYLLIAIAGYTSRGKEANCKYLLNSEVSAEWKIDNNSETEFVVREGLSSGKVYEIESILVINSAEEINISITITATINGQEILISGLYEAANNLVRVDGKNTWMYLGGHQGVGEIYLFKGIDFYGAPENLNSDNVKITVDAQVTKA